ncbi:hypothetical protein ALO43_200350 [Pseudomonas tremae]|uniref:Uncharacterized protein n=1 Tax=Pseudomonas tremae TaxID=200454 RepID=A0AA40P4U2_9PSED|nr:hypothetical protein ALO43_200350 [Pseudomonas tremae]
MSSVARITQNTPIEESLQNSEKLHYKGFSMSS